MSNVLYLNGEFTPLDQARIDPYDHSYLYGDGVFEGIRAYSGRVFKLREHAARLLRSARSLMINVPLTEDEVVEATLEVCRRNGISDGYIRPVITRGSGLGLDPRVCKEANVMIATDKLSLYPKEMYENGLEIVTVSTRVPPAQCISPSIKSTGKYIGNIQAKIEANRMGAGEGLMLNIEGYVAEATGDNLFIIRNGKLITPPVYAGILEGITRNTVMDLAREMGIPVVETLFTLFDVYCSDEVFMTGTAAELIPVSQVDGRTIGVGKAGDMTKRFMEAYHKLTQVSGEAI